MSAIMDVKCVLSPRAFDSFYENFHIPEEVHHVLPNQGDTMHERHDEKIGSRHYNLDEETYPLFLDKDVEDMDIFAFIHTPNPTKVKIIERERIEDEPRLMGLIVIVRGGVGGSGGGGVWGGVRFGVVVPERGENELEASVDRMFDEDDSGTQMEQGNSAIGGGGQGVNIQPVIEVVDATAEDVAPAQPRRQKKRKTIVTDTGGPSHPPKKLKEDHETLNRPSVAGKSWSAVQRLLVGAVLNAEVRGANVMEAEVDSLVRSTVPLMTTVTTVIPPVYSAAITKEKTVKPSLFGAGSSSAGGTDPTSGGFSGRVGSDFLVGGIRTVIDSDSDLQKVYITQWNVTNGSRLDYGCVCREMVNEFDPPKFFASVGGMEHDQLFIEFNVGAARQMSLSAEEAHMLLKEAEAAEAIRLRAKVSNFKTLEKSLRDEVNALNERNTILEKERNTLDVKSQHDNLGDPVHELQVSSSKIQEKLSNYENLTKRLEEFQDAHLKVVNDKFNKLYADFVEMALHLEEKFYTQISSLPSPAVAAIGKAIAKGIQDGLSAGITHETLAERLGLSESQPHVDQLMVHIHQSLDKTVVGASALSLPLDVSDARVRKIRENIASHRSVLYNVFVPLAEPFFTTVVTGITVAPIFVDDYEVTGTNDQAVTNENVADGNANPFPNVEDVELNVL
ncbi:hypothetical protein Tco_1569018 [Tanacetum coccineum]